MRLQNSVSVNAMRRKQIFVGKYIPSSMLRAMLLSNTCRWISLREKTDVYMYISLSIPSDVSAMLVVALPHYNDVIMGPIVSQIASLTIVYSIVYSDADQRKYQSSASLAFVRGNHRFPVNSPLKWPVTQKMFLFDDVIMDNVQN